jgi:RNA polymerase sigma-70 factor (ECF subfamily)
MEAALQENTSCPDALPDEAGGTSGTDRRNGRRNGAGPSLEALPDGRLVGLVLDGDGAAFEALMRRYNRRLFRIVRAILRDDAAAEDVVQEAYVRAYLRLGQLSDPAAFGGWLARIAANEALEWARQGRARYGAPTRRAAVAVSEETVQDYAEQMLMAGLVQDVRTPEEMAAAGEIRRLLERAIDALPDGFRAVFVLRAVEQLSTEETAACLGLRPMTVKTRYFRAKMLLRKALHRHAMTQAPAAFPFAGARCDRTVAAVLRRISMLPPPRRASGPRGAACLSRFRRR